MTETSTFQADTITVQVYRDTQDPSNLGWAWRCDRGPVVGSGSLDGFETHEHLTVEMAESLARDAMAECEASEALVYWQGEDAPLTVRAEGGAS